MDSRYATTHMKTGDPQLEGPFTRLYNTTYQLDGYSLVNEKCLKRNYDEMAGSFGNHQAMLNGRCFNKQIPQQQQLVYRQPYTIPMSTPLNLQPVEMQNIVQEPKFPPQTFDIPDIQDSNSVFSDGSFQKTFANYATSVHLPERHLYFYNHLPPPSDLSSPQSTTLMSSSSFLNWQPGVISSTGSTNSSPISQGEEPSSTDASTVNTQQQQSLKINGFTSSASHSVEVAASRLPNKKARSTKRRKRKDPNEPQKPVSAYSLFFRNAQAAIKSQNPNASFGDVSKIVASMWDGLDDDVKNFYKRQMETAKKEYLKQLAIYRATLVSKDIQVKTNTDQETTSPKIQPERLQQRTEEIASQNFGSVTPLCMSSSAYTSQIPMSPAREAMSHMISTAQQISNHHHQQTSPLFYPDGPNSHLSGNFSTPNEVSMLRNTFIGMPYKQKLDDPNVPVMSEHGYFPSSSSSSSTSDQGGGGYKSRQYLPMENNFINGHCRDISGQFVVQTEDTLKLT